MDAKAIAAQKTLFGHPTGLFNLFFAEMWERFSYYGMRALLVLYMIKGFLGYGDSDAYAVYGAYTALVYMTPFFGGMLADRLLGQRRAVVLGGLLMAAGHMVMMVEQELFFFLALGLIIAGNGFFKPNISTMVGTLYRQGDHRRDGGFIIFYMGINLGAALAPLLCGYVGETYGWHYGFGLATVGMMIGLAVFVVPSLVAQGLILGGAVATSAAMVYLQRNAHFVAYALYVLVAIALLIAGFVAFRALGRGGLPDWAGQPPDQRKVAAGSRWVYLGTAAAIPLFGLLVWASLTKVEANVIPESFYGAMQDSDNGALSALGTILEEVAKPAGLILGIAAIGALVYLLREAFRLDRVPRERMFVALILIFFSMLFWACFEQAGSSINNFTDRNVDRVFEDRVITQADVGSTIVFRTRLKTDREDLKQLPPLGQEQLGYPFVSPETREKIVTAARLVESSRQKLTEDDLAKLEADLRATSTLTMTALSKLSEAAGESAGEVPTIKDPSKPPAVVLDAATREAMIARVQTVDCLITPEHVGMALDTPGGTEMPASIFQSVNAIFILLFGIPFTLLWAWMAARRMEPSTPFKFALGLLQLSLGFFALYMGAQGADGRGMVHVGWLVLGYLLHTTGELCVSPVGLSMITRLSPQILVSTMMGMWFVGTACSNYLAAIIAQFTKIEDGSGGTGEQVIPAPKETLGTYSEVFQTVGVATLICAAICFLMVPLLKKWMHTELEGQDGQPARGGH